MFSPDTQQNLTTAIYLLLAHNWVLILYVGGLGASSLLAIRHPTRGLVLLMLGFGFLIFGFQYSKHIQDALLEQTRTSLITERPSYRIERYLQIVFDRALPLGLPTVGWSLVVVGTYIHWRGRNK